MGVNDKVAATFHPATTYECIVCGGPHLSASAAHDCCSSINLGDD